MGLKLNWWEHTQSELTKPKGQISDHLDAQREHLIDICSKHDEYLEKRKLNNKTTIKPKEKKIIYKLAESSSSDSSDEEEKMFMYKTN